MSQNLTLHGPVEAVALAQTSGNRTVELSGRRFLLGCALAAEAIVVLGMYVTVPAWVLAVEVFAAIIALFVFGSIRYRLDKNALTYGAGLITTATFFAIWWPTSALRAQVAAEGVSAWWLPVREQLLTFHGLDELVHLDTMLFILGLTLFVAIIAQTRLLESVTFFLLRKNRGRVVPTVIAVTAVVAFASGILDGVSMIGLTIRTLIIILVLARAPIASMRVAVIVCTAVTTINGIWLAYGEPPNLIMKANLTGPQGQPLLTDGFFLTYCLPAAILTYLVIAWTLSRKLKGMKVDLEGMDILDSQVGAVRFLQATRHGHVYSPIEFLERHGHLLGGHTAAIVARLQKAESLGQAMVSEQIDPATRQKVLSAFLSPELAPVMDRYYAYAAAGDATAAQHALTEAQAILRDQTAGRASAQKVGLAAVGAFIVGLFLHALFHHQVPLFAASFAGFAVAILGVMANPKLRNLALHEGRHEYSEYLFLIPLFLSITLLSRVGFFDQLGELLHLGIAHLGVTSMAVAQFLGATGLSALLDNNVVADFVARALHGLPEATLFLFAMAQISGYAAGGCWTHIGSAQSVVAYAFIQREVDDRYTPLMWIKDMTPILLTIVGVLTAYIVIVGMITG